jgi:predicted permease
VSSQAAVSLTLVAMAGLLGRSLSEATWFDVGFDPARLVVARANTSGLGLDDARGYAYHAETMARVGALPGVDAVTAASVVPLGGNNEQREIAIDGYVPPADGPSFTIDNNVVWPGYFATMGIPLVRGRAFGEPDGRPEAPVVAVVNETMARRYWAGGDAIGRTIRLSDDQRAEVVGVVKDVSVYALGEAPLPYLYLPFGPVPFADGLTFHVRTGLDESVMARQLAAELRRSDPRVRVVNAMAYRDLRAASLFPARAMTVLSAGFGAVALLLLLAGTYGVTSFVVAGRRREFALRVALGADPSAMRAGVVGRALAWGLPGVLAGAAVTAALGRLLQRFLFDVSPLDPWTMAAAALVVLAASALAAYLPARRLALADLAAQLKV